MEKEATSSNFGSSLARPFSCSSCTHQVPNQLHALNGQFPMPTMVTLNNRNTHMGNLHGSGMVIPNGPPSMSSQCFPNAAASNLHVVQNGYVGLPLNLNQVAPFPQNGQFCNMPQNLNQMVLMQPQGQFLLHNHQQNMNQTMLGGCLQAQHLNKNMPLQQFGQLCAHGLSQNPNQILGFPNGNLSWQNQMQNFNQIAPRHCLQYPMGNTHVTPFNMQPNSQPPFASSDKNPHGPASQNTNFAMNSQLAVGNSNANPNNVVVSNEAKKYNNQDKCIFSQPIVGQNAMQESSIGAQQAQGSLFPLLSQGPMQILQHQKNNQLGGFKQPQGNDIQGGNNNASNINQGNPTKKNFNRNLHGCGRFQKSQFLNMSNEKGKFMHTTGNRGKGNCNRGAGKPHPPNKKVMADFKRSLPLTYTEEEIRQWREERKKNFPSKTNMEKKLAGRNENGDINNASTKVRRQQLKEILAKQAELGVEVAEIPPNYLSDTENRVSKREDMKMTRKRKGRYRNKYDKRGDHGRETGWVKKQRLGGDGQSLPSVPTKRNGTLLEKLLSADIKREKSHLLQAFRFMLLNSFFEDWPEKPLEFPLIRVKDAGLKDEIVKDKGSMHERDGDASGAIESIVSEETAHQPQDLSLLNEDDNNDDEYNYDDDDLDNKEEGTVYGHVGGQCCLAEGIEKSETEEGEITD